MTLLVFPAAAEDTPSSPGFNHFYNLEYDQALAEFEKAAQQDPNAIGPHNHIAQLSRPNWSPATILSCGRRS
jgi:hypothetical protein